MPNTMASPTAGPTGTAAAISPPGKGATILRAHMVHDGRAASQAPVIGTVGTFGATLTAATRLQGAAAATAAAASVAVPTAIPGTPTGTPTGTPPGTIPVTNPSTAQATPSGTGPVATPVLPHATATTLAAPHRDPGRNARAPSTEEGSTAQPGVAMTPAQAISVQLIPPPQAKLATQAAPAVTVQTSVMTAAPGPVGMAALADAPAAAEPDHPETKPAVPTPIATGETRTDALAPPAGQPGPPSLPVQAAGSAVANAAMDTVSAPAGIAAIAVPTAEKSSAQVQTASTSESPGASAALSDQIAPVLIRLAAADGSRQISLQLTPHELGRVDIQIDQPKDGPAQVTLTATRPDTLALLQRDQDQLSQALDRAGLPTEGRVVAFHLAASDPNPATPPTSPQVPATSAPAMPAGSADPGMGGFSGGQAGGQSNDARRSGFARTPSADATADPEAGGWTMPAASALPGYGTRAGLNITA